MRNLNMDVGDEKIKGKKTCLPIILMQPLRTEYSSHYFASECYCKIGSLFLIMYTVILRQLNGYTT